MPCAPKSFRSFPVLETGRLRLRASGPGDAEATLAVLSSEEVCRYYDLSPLTVREEATKIIANRAAAFSA